VAASPGHAAKARSAPSDSPWRPGRPQTAPDGRPPTVWRECEALARASASTSPTTSNGANFVGDNEFTKKLALRFSQEPSRKALPRRDRRRRAGRERGMALPHAEKQGRDGQNGNRKPDACSQESEVSRPCP
jgi:hypothetical protein